MIGRLVVGLALAAGSVGVGAGAALASPTGSVSPCLGKGPGCVVINGRAELSRPWYAPAHCQWIIC